MNISSAIQQATVELHASSDSPRLDAELLMSYCLKCSRTYLYSHSEYELTDKQQSFWYHLLQARKNHQPIAYLTGQKEFWSLDFALSHHALIPRPATECLIEYILGHASSDRPLSVCDLGTGSGAIAVSLAKSRPQWKITAVDVQATAIALARYNAHYHHCAQIQFYQSDWFNKLPQNTFDIIVSNPPYIDETDVHLQQGDVQHEPRIALQSPRRGMHDLLHIIEQSSKHLHPNGMLILEHGYQQQDDVLNALTEFGFKNAQGFLDHDQQPRFCVALKKD
jgi:release factor glutamine methyltransferase